MPGRSFEILYPGGDFEIDASGQHAPPAVGDTIRRNGKLWRVVTRKDGPPVIVRVELADVGQAPLRLRFPDGTVEIRWNGSHAPEVGALVSSRGLLWRVTRHAEETVFLEDASGASEPTNDE